MVRLLFNGVYIASTTDALFVWEHPYYPQLYLPKSAFNEARNAKKLQIHEGELIHDDHGSSGRVIGGQWTLQVGSRSTDQVIAFSHELSDEADALKHMVKVDFGAVDQWFEEDTPIFVHPKDPFKRIDLLQSTRPIKVSIGGVRVAATTTSVHLYETGLPCRYYIPLTSIDPAVLRPSKTRSQCPYKGEAEYYSVEVNGELHEDVVWYYNRPTLECGKAESLCCFYNEKVDIELDGRKLERPVTQFGKVKGGQKPNLGGGEWTQSGRL